jgi:hypothetical protein
VGVIVIVNIIIINKKKIKKKNKKLKKKELIFKLIYNTIQGGNGFGIRIRSRLGFLPPDFINKFAIF